jgi:hypothetical protein
MLQQFLLDHETCCAWLKYEWGLYDYVHEKNFTSGSILFKKSFKRFQFLNNIKKYPASTLQK